MKFSNNLRKIKGQLYLFLNGTPSQKRLLSL
jgi:hypothetical protein